MKVLTLISGFLALFGFSQCHLLIADKTMSKMIQFTTTAPYCYVHKDRDYIQHTLLNTDQRKIKITSDEEIEKIENICKKKQLKSSYQGGFIYPGTKWCGPGSVAKNNSELGNHYREDMCCRDHDNCPQALARGECKQGICNNSLFTRSHCDCDAAFRKCLQNVNTETANTIGAIFFNVVQVICFKQRNPCSDHQSNSPVDSQVDCQDANIESIEFVLSDRYKAKPRTEYWSTKGEVLESFFNRFLRKIRLL